MAAILYFLFFEMFRAPEIRTSSWASGRLSLDRPYLAYKVEKTIFGSSCRLLRGFVKSRLFLFFGGNFYRMQPMFPGGRRLQDV